MQFLEFARICEHLEGISGRLDLIEQVSTVLPGLDDEELPIFVRFIMGRIFPDWSPKKLGVGPNLLYDAVAYVVGTKRSVVREAINAIGDAGLAIEDLLANKEQTSFFVQEMDLLEVYQDFERVAAAEGARSQREKLLLVRKLFANARPLEGRYLARLMLGELRIGMGEGNVRDAIARAFDIDVRLIEHAQGAMNDLGEVALLARRDPVALSQVTIEPFRPVKMMLAQAGTIAAQIEDHGEVAVEYKYDGSRFQFHKVGDLCRIYSRRLEEVTGSLPDIVMHLGKATDHDVILDGEVVAVQDGRPMPFQYVIRRFRRKHQVNAMMEKIEVVPRVFDILYLDGETLMDRPLIERRRILEEVLDDAHIAPQFLVRDAASAEAIYTEALDLGHEGVMVKVPSSPYTPGVRGRLWVKVKPGVETLDLAVIGAEWGEGRRAKMFGSFLLAVQDQGRLLPVGKVATGITDEVLADLYALLKDSVIARSGKEVTLEPKVVFEVGYSEIQASPNYESGYALRFPRFVGVREDKGVDEVETLDALVERYRQQNIRQGSGSPAP
ncbi:MAG TPA: ATP-dependent DNA ligase [Candidatus Methanoculleus thermohydrogenotrophicum]|nr:ATP-dependent DNA ligase [Candidatus Methanoculleus thermohydrogenotrophicum]NLM81496.1 ATP-dependent DNA ligase [Candidatus Methanoculleus thermohydrogenotrophicum]HOB18593.1 ATP-dependent DNA ligase [Candidatus Methanoculleus thermohydrogenotrophicum]HPZ38692.1 ATP-dependent DNA ligase [Candidatus Methanoculleus thermohydrogenotrophicum]HQC91867.1 ATP-dependent DNA ligase [Candidatus Methanoculleus thermohydrogenotrophicum]